MKPRLTALYGLKYNPFTPDVPVDAIHAYAGLESFCWRIEHTFIREGGFALISGDPGTGKSVALRLLADKLTALRDVQVGVLTHSSARLSDFYREMGDIFGVTLSAHNRWGGFKGLRERWQQHLESALLRPILFIDEAQEMPISVLNELRLLTSAQFDSRLLLSIVLAGDQRLNDKLRHDELVPLGSRIRMRFNTEYADTNQLMQSLMHLLESAGNPDLMTKELMRTLCDHAMGNYRALCTMAAELLAVAAQQEKAQLDEKLYLECFAVKQPARKQKNVVGGTRG
ncbi:MAG: general secretion pathway protein GspA [Gammaproteobacteria bacterium CG11_big_fil_rev_8_21_14_0_20_46_22]|nr:MAG: general secretion pathway protein GspA [Gammaproteobacteria bacterium CG12_big_fil_rev_8_21_14_0_65_46_12]PIR11799.1 MAG: general secretion pathway protein GspA [Gammaproteobacteria bacterium CG11_big_fil_rev_8_21_14_0_20_46_22]